jgi:hypothetical protein
MDESKGARDESQQPECCCGDPYAGLPAELRPKSGWKKGALRRVECPECGQVYWSNRDVDICITCEKGRGRTA